MHHLVVDINYPGKGHMVYKYQAPAGWDEMTAADLLIWASVMGTKRPLLKAKRLLFVLLFRIPVHRLKHIPTSQITQHTRQFDFLFRRNRLKKWLIPCFWLFLKRYHGPKDLISNLTIDEFKLTELCYEQFQITREIEYLNTLAAILYRPRRKGVIDNDIREQLTNYGYVKRAKRFKWLSLRLRYAIFLNYEGCRNFVIDSNKDVFSSGSSGSGKQRLTQWSKIIEAAAGGKFGTMSETKQSNIHEFLSELGSRIREQKERERNLK